MNVFEINAEKLTPREINSQIKQASEEYDKNNLSNYHMLSIVQRFIKREGNTDIYEIKNVRWTLYEN